MMKTLLNAIRNANEARICLQQALDRRDNMLPGKALLAPATDDSFTALMQDSDCATHKP
jgi:hypothetical protein